MATEDPQAAVRARLEELAMLARPTPPPSPELERVARALREIHLRVLTGADDPAALAPLAERLESLATALARKDAATSRFREGDLAERRMNARGTHPLVGAVSPVAPPIALSAAPDAVAGDVEFDARFEGNLGWVHGGFVAAGFDILVVAAARLSGRAGPTGTLTVVYRKPTPLGVPLRYEGRVERVEGRKVFVRCELRARDGEPLFAEATGIVVCRSR